MQTNIWTHERGVPLDFNGPVDRPFTPFAPEDLEKSPVARFDQMAVAYADRLAVDDGHTQLSYAQLRRAAQALARILADRTPPDRPVAAVLH
jgi:non-ribosomal peptide synthetase component F